MTTKTKLQIIDETVNYYSFSPTLLRAKNGMKCQYSNGKGGMCAVGRCMTPQALLHHGANEDNFQKLLETVTKKDIYYLHVVTDLLKAPYRGHQLSFWMDLQDLHDNDRNWDLNGLSDAGKRKADYLRIKWAD